jgi:hypothetical protein
MLLFAPRVAPRFIGQIGLIFSDDFPNFFEEDMEAARYFHFWIDVLNGELF